MSVCVRRRKISRSGIPALLKPAHEMRQCDFGIGNFRMPFLLPLEREKAFVVQTYKSVTQLKQREVSVAGEYVLSGMQVFDVYVANRRPQDRCAGSRRFFGLQQTVG